jgi:hypothetical protein
VISDEYCDSSLPKRQYDPGYSSLLDVGMLGVLVEDYLVLVKCSLIPSVLLLVQLRKNR